MDTTTAGRAGPADDDPFDWAVLAAADGIGPVTFGRLLEAAGSPSAVLRAVGESTLPARRSAFDLDVDDVLDEGWLTPREAAAIRAAAAGRVELAASIRSAGVALVIQTEIGYPDRLRRIPHPPPVLYVAGDPSALEPPNAVAVVGTRRPTESGRSFAARLGEALGSTGATVVSGLAMGVDTEAHAGALRARGSTVAVLGGGHGHLYPARNRALAARIASGGGAVVSEHPPNVSPNRGTFPRRNRVISGLADATVVVEAGARSGALTTAAWALEQGRGLHLVPGRPGDASVAGSLAFLREAGPEARVVVGIAELLEDLGLVDPAPGRGSGSVLAAAGAPVGGTEEIIARALAMGAETVDDLAVRTGLAPAAILAALTLLEVRGLASGAFGRYRPAGPLSATGPPRPPRPPLPTIR